MLPGTSITFTTTAADADNPLSSLTYEWRVDGLIQPGQTGTSFTKAFSADSTVRVTVRDPGNLSGFDEAEVTIILNQPPVADANGPYSFSEGGSVTLNGAGSSDPDGDALTYRWDINNDGTYDVTTTSVTTTVSWATLVGLGIDDGPAGPLTIKLEVDDGNGETDTDTATLNVTNTPPMLTNSGAASVDEGSTYTLGLNSSDPGDDTITSWEISWGDGNVETVSGDPSSATHIYADGPNSYTVSATATDEDGTFSANTLTVTVDNVVPMVDAGADQTIDEGDSIIVSTTFSDPEFDSTGGISSFIRMAGIGGNFGNREFDDIFSSGDRPGTIDRISESSFNALTPAQLRDTYDVLLFTWASSTSLNGDWNTRIKPYLDLGGSVFWEDDRNVTDLSPGVLGFQFDGSYGSSYELTPILGLTDGIVGNFANHHLQVTSWLPEFQPFIFGPGGSPTLGLAGAFPSGGRMIVIGPDMDYHAERGGSGAGGNQYQFILNQVDWLVVRNEFTATVDWGDDSPVEPATLTSTNGSSGTPTSGTVDARAHTYADNGTYTVEVCVEDNDGGIGCDTLIVTVNNVAPIADAGGDQTVEEGDLVTLNGSFTDVGEDDGHKEEWTVVASNGQLITGLTIDNLVGDSNGSGGSSFSFTPGDNGAYTVTYKVTDDDGGVHSVTAVITVNNDDPTLSGLSATPILENGTTTFSGTIADVVTLDTFTVEIDWDNDGTYDETHLNVGAGLFSYSHQYLDDNPTATSVDYMPIKVKVTDDDTGSATGNTTVEVTNDDPVNTGLSNTSPECGDAAEGQSISISGSFTDVGIQDTHTALINWGDGSVDTVATIGQGAGSGSFAGTHAYPRRWLDRSLCI